MRYFVLACLAVGGCGTSTGGDDMGVGDLTMLPMNCTNGMKDADETDVDCGGASCPACGAGKGCKKASDCSSLFCTNMKCDAASCSDGIKNGDESDVDCGGTGGCAGCANGKMCVGSLDCLSFTCTNGTCAVTPCMNGKKDGAETDVDCGGGTCPTCAAGKMCVDGSDCMGGTCTNNTCKAAAGCGNMMKDGSETDVDCGGGMCPTCADGKMCGIPADCTSGVCTNNVCAKPLMCMAGTGNCDGNPNNGCEANLTSDTQNCGMCGKACGMLTPFCVNGVCGAMKPKVLVLFSDGFVNDTGQDVQAKLMATGAFSSVDLINAKMANPPTLQQLTQYFAVIVFFDTSPQNEVALGDDLATYFENGGHVVIAPFANAGVPIQGRFGKQYMLIDPTGQLDSTTDSLGKILEPNSSLVLGLNALTAKSAHRSTGGLLNGAVVVAEWLGGRPMIVRGEFAGKKRVDLNMYPPSFDVRNDCWKGDGAAILRNALLYQ